MDDFLERLESHDWLGEPSSPGEELERVAPALAAAWRDETGAYEMLMRALGNRHEDAWFPVLLSAMPFLQAVIERGPGAGAHDAIYLLRCFCNTFSIALEDSAPGMALEDSAPDPDLEWAQIVETGAQRELAFDDALEILVPTLARIKASSRADAEEAAGLLVAIGGRRRRRLR